MSKRKTKPHCWGASGPIYSLPPFGDLVSERVCIDCGAILRTPLRGPQEIVPPRYKRACNDEWRPKP